MFIRVSYSIVYLISQSFDGKAAGYKWDEGAVLKVLVGLLSNLRAFFACCMALDWTSPAPKSKTLNFKNNNNSTTTLTGRNQQAAEMMEIWKSANL